MTEFKSPPFLLIVPHEASGARLDRFLTSALRVIPDPPSRAELQRWIEHGRVRIDGKARKASDKLREGAEVVVEPEPRPLSQAIAEDGIEFEVLHLDDDIVVLNKPAGLVVHPARGHATGTLVNGLLARGLFEATTDALLDPGSPTAHLRPGIVHRLDRGTSGVMVVARTGRAREHLKAQFASHSIDREYQGICVGDVMPRTFATLHGRHATDRLRFTTNVAQGKRAVTHVQIIEKFSKNVATHVVCRLETGRTHQIRVHLSDGSTPLLGDSLYGRAPRNPYLRTLAERLGRPALHARKLGFVHPRSGATMTFEVEPPVDYVVVLTALRALA